MVGVPRSRGCARCVKRRVKVSGPRDSDIGRHAKSCGSVTNDYRDVPSVKYMVRPVQATTEGSNLSPGSHTGLAGASQTPTMQVQTTSERTIPVQPAAKTLDPLNWVLFNERYRRHLCLQT